MDQTLESALDAARRAVNFDKNEQHRQAVYYYSIAINLLKNFSNIPTLANKHAEYQERITQIQQTSKYIYQVNNHSILMAFEKDIFMQF